MRKQSVVLVLAAAWVAGAACSRGPGLPKAPPRQGALELGGAIQGGPYFLGPEQLSAIPQRTVRGVDPQTGRAATWQGTALHELLERLKLRRGADTLVVTTSDGETIPVPVWKILEMRPVLADRADGTALPDRVIAWPNVEQPGLDGDPRSRAWWARRVTKLAVVDWERAFGRALRAPAGASDEARLGSGQYALRCVACHRLRGVGGEKGPELTRAGERLDLAGFSAALGRHPEYARDAARTGAPPQHAVRQLWTFLREVARAGPAVAEEPQDEPRAPPELEGGPAIPHARR